LGNEINTIDDLMDLDPLEMTDDHIDGVIAYHRQNRMNLEQGIKPKKAQGPSVSLDSVINALAVKATGELPEKPVMKRRV
jgi:hypothetical protein